MEDYLKIQQARAARTSELTAKLFTPKSNRLNYGDDNESHVSSDISAFYSPPPGNASTLLDKSRQHQRSVLKVYMENQLDLNEAEMDYYENVVNDLVEKLERLRTENEELQILAAAQDNSSQKRLESDEIKRLSIEFDYERADFTNKIVSLEQKLHKLNNVS